MKPHQQAQGVPESPETLGRQKFRQRENTEIAQYHQRRWESSRSNLERRTIVAEGSGPRAVNRNYVGVRECHSEAGDSEHQSNPDADVL